jgi:hypothetical protein
MASPKREAPLPDPTDLDALATRTLEEALDEALEPFRGTMPEAELEWMREQLRAVATQSEAMSELVARAAPRDVEQSGEALRPRLGR